MSLIKKRKLDFVDAERTFFERRNFIQFQEMKKKLSLYSDLLSQSDIFLRNTLSFFQREIGKLFYIPKNYISLVELNPERIIFDFFFKNFEKKTFFLFDPFFRKKKFLLLRNFFKDSFSSHFLPLNTEGKYDLSQIEVLFEKKKKEGYTTFILFLESNHEVLGIPQNIEFFSKKIRSLAKKKGIELYIHLRFHSSLLSSELNIHRLAVDSISFPTTFFHFLPQKYFFLQKSGRINIGFFECHSPLYEYLFFDSLLHFLSRRESYISRIRPLIYFFYEEWKKFFNEEFIFSSLQESLQINRISFSFPYPINEELAIRLEQKRIRVMLDETCRFYSHRSPNLAFLERKGDLILSISFNPNHRKKDIFSFLRTLHEEYQFVFKNYDSFS